MEITQEVLDKAYRIYMKHAHPDSNEAWRDDMRITLDEFRRQWKHFECRLGCCLWRHMKLRIKQNGRFWVDTNHPPSLHSKRKEIDEIKAKIEAEWKDNGIEIMEA